jgi:hypothetical protein
MWTRCLTTATLLVLVVSVSASGRTTSENKQAAQLDAQLLLGRLELPTGAVQLAREPAGGGSVLRVPGPLVLTTNVVDVGGWWRVPRPVLKTLAFFERHRPPGANGGANGTGGHGAIVTNAFVLFDWPAVPGVLFMRSVQVVMAALPGGSTGVRADADVQWTVPRPASERVPRGAHLLTVTRNTLPGWPPPLSLAVTDRTEVRRVAATLDGLQIVQAQVIACPALFPAPTIAFTFYARAGGPPLARASMPADGPDGPCAPITFSVRGRRETPLLARPAFLRKAGRVLGVTLH